MPKSYSDTALILRAPPDRTHHARSVLQHLFCQTAPTAGDSLGRVALPTQALAPEKVHTTHTHLLRRGEQS